MGERVCLECERDRVVGGSFYLGEVDFIGHVSPVSVFVALYRVVEHPCGVKATSYSASFAMVCKIRLMSYNERIEEKWA
jgi:hypothetical protein